MGEFIVEPNNGVLDESVSSGNLVTSQYRRKLNFRKRKMLARFKISIQMQREISNFNSNANFKCKVRFKSNAKRGRCCPLNGMSSMSNDVIF